MSKDEMAMAEQPRSFVSRSFETWSKVASSIPRTAALSMVGPAILIVLGYFFWLNYFAGRIDRSYSGIKAENITLTAKPQWIQTDIIGEVFAGSQISTMSLQDRDACSNIAAAFKQHPWIKRVVHANKMGGLQVKVEVEYRRPFAWIYYEDKHSIRSAPETEPVAHAASTGEDFYLIVDVNGVNLPSKDFTSEDVLKFPHIYCPGVDLPRGPVGTAYTDPRILNALKIAALIEEQRMQKTLHSINIVAEKSNSFGSRWIYNIKLTDNRVIEWGHAPGEETSGEPDSKSKLEKIKAQVTGEVPQPVTTI
jgi:hypothetical protein